MQRRLGTAARLTGLRDAVSEGGPRLRDAVSEVYSARPAALECGVRSTMTIRRLLCSRPHARGRGARGDADAGPTDPALSLCRPAGRRRRQQHELRRRRHPGVRHRSRAQVRQARARCRRRCRCRRPPTAARCRRRKRSRASPRTPAPRGSTCRPTAASRPSTCSPTSSCGSSATKSAAPIASRSRPTARRSTRRCSARRNGSSPTRRPARRSRRSTSRAPRTTRSFQTTAARVYFEAEGNTRTMSVVDAKTRTIVKEIGPFGNMVRPFTFNGKQTLLFANINDLLGFEIADLKTGAVLHHVDVPGVTRRQVADPRHPEPRHRDDAGRDRDLDRRQREQLPSHFRRDRDAAGDEGERQGARRARLDHLRHRRQARLSLHRRRRRRQTKQIVATLQDENGANAESEKMLEIDFAGGKPAVAGDQFGKGKKR